MKLLVWGGSLMPSNLTRLRTEFRNLPILRSHKPQYLFYLLLETEVKAKSEVWKHKDTFKTLSKI